MDIQSLKIDIIHWLTQLQDKNILEKINAIKEEEGYELTSAQRAELDKRLEKYGRGEMKFRTWEETKASIRKRSKDAL
jgi:putative addiction module component (TIGR02574 family)